MAPTSLQWCAHPQLARDEALSWWLHRFAWANAISNHTLTGQLFGGRAFWSRDVDRFAPILLVDRRASLLGLSTNRLRAATLRRYEGVLFPRLTIDGWLPWITPVGVFHRTQQHHGHAYCPQCLAEGRSICIAGRLAFEIACSRHQCLLWDACPRCDAPVTFARVELAMAGRFPCPTCGANLAAAPRRPLVMRALAFEHRCHAAMRRGFAQIGTEGVSAAEFFTGTRTLLRGLYGRRYLNGLTDASTIRCLRWPASARPTTPFEHWRLQTRQRPLAALEAYLRDWPEQFLRDAKRSRVYRCRFESTDAPSPSWLSDVMAEIEPALTRL